LKIKPQDLHFWSTQLTLSFSEKEEKTVIRGLYGPNPTIWTIIALGYGATGVLGFFSLFFGLSLWSLDKDPWVLWITAIMGVFQNSSGARRVARSKNSYNLGCALGYAVHIMGD
jgi:hypothetical protein